MQFTSWSAPSRLAVEGAPAIAYRRAGPPAAVQKLLMLHGIGSNSLSFRLQLTALSTDFDVVAWDAPGYGASDDPPGAFSLEDFADAAARLIDGVGWENTHVLGHSFGGVIAQMLYHRGPQRVRSLILSDTNVGSAALPEPERSQRLQRRLDDITSLSPRQLAERRAPHLVPAGAPPGLIQDLIDIMAQVRPAGYSAAAVALGATDLRGQLVAIRVPTLVVHGELDSIIPPSTAFELANAIAGAQLVIIPGAGHVSNQHKPDAYNAAVRAFVESLQ